MNNDEFMVSVCMITYNQELYIKQTIEGILMQKCNFPIELIIGEDCSTDGTRVICEEYATCYPIIHLLSSEFNLGVMPNFIRTLQACTGKYIAICEGDDYWTDHYKLQKQVDFLEANEKYSFCFHNAEIKYCDTGFSKPFNARLKPGQYNTKDLLLKKWFIPTASILIRKKYLQNSFPDWFNHIYSGDYALELLLSIKGDFYYFDEKMSVYRKNAINSLSINGSKGLELARKHLYLLENFKHCDSKKNYFSINYAITIARFKMIRVHIYQRFPCVDALKNKILDLINFFNNIIEKSRRIN